MAVDDKLEIFKEDVIRLFNAAKAFEKKFAESSKNLTDQVKMPNKVVAKKKPPTASKKKQKNTVYFLLHRNFHDIHFQKVEIMPSSLHVFVTWFWRRRYQSRLFYAKL